MSFLFSFGVILSVALVALVDRHRDDILGNLVAIKPLLTREAVHSLLGVSGSIYWGCKSLDDDEIVMDDRGRGLSSW